MKFLPVFSLLLFCAIGLMGCRAAPGKPLPGSEAKRPDQILEFRTLYKENCSACHGNLGRMGAAISLANPAYLSFVGVANLERITANGVPGTMMPPFSKKAGGVLTDPQIAVLAQGIVSSWGRPSAPSGLNPLPYASNLRGDMMQGRNTFIAFCSRCHGTDAEGAVAGAMHTGSLVEPAYLSLISDQGLRSLIVAGQPDQGMPGSTSDLPGDGARPMTDQEVTDVVAWLASHRTTTPGQPYQPHP
jgi:cytochrome c oxidase cbb3-type subunit 3/ubiquinol-cytochrome c reductase cytochrome c subunit